MAGRVRRTVSLNAVPGAADFGDILAVAAGQGNLKSFGFIPVVLPAAVPLPP
jgi:hypothetical protein